MAGKIFGVIFIFALVAAAVLQQAPSAAKMVADESTRVEDACGKGDKQACDYIAAAIRAEGK